MAMSTTAAMPILYQKRTFCLGPWHNPIIAKAVHLGLTSSQSSSLRHIALRILIALGRKFPGRGAEQSATCNGADFFEEASMLGDWKEMFEGRERPEIEFAGPYRTHGAATRARYAT